MIQRIQSIYLFLSLVVSGGLVFVFDLWRIEDGTPVFAGSLFKSTDTIHLFIGIAFFLVALLAFVSIFLFKNRKLQITLNRINIVINFVLLSLLVYVLLNISGETAVSEKGIGSFLPLVSIVLLVLANRAIQKDEDLVKSVERIR